MLFADDCFLFFQAPPKEGEAMRHILSLYELASGQSINLNKSKIFYSRNVPSNVQNTITNIMGAECLGMGRYLGVPSLVGRSKRAVFGHVRDKVWKRIQSWEGHWLSSAGNEVMIKAVLQAIPSFLSQRSCQTHTLLPLLILHPIPSFRLFQHIIYPSICFLIAS